jgi:HEPN domain-containing protein
MVDKEFVLPWLYKADNDYSTAEYLAQNMYPVPIEIVCFHCQQAAEKYLKCFLVYNDQEPPKIHDLIELIRLCGKINTDFLQLNLKCEYLTPFAVHIRYPSDIDLLNEDMLKALSCAKGIIEFVKSKMPELFKSPAEGQENG